MPHFAHFMGNTICLADMKVILKRNPYNRELMQKAKTLEIVHSFHRAGAAHPHLPHRVRAPPHLVFGKSSVWVRRPAINGI
jgi:hypothetical protein